MFPKIVVISSARSECFFFVATFLLYMKTLFAATVPVCLYSKSERFSQRNLHDVFYCTQLRFVQRNFGTFQLYTNSLFAATFVVCYSSTQKRFVQRNVCSFVLYTNTLFAANFLV